MGVALAGSVLGCSGAPCVWVAVSVKLGVCVTVGSTLVAVEVEVAVNVDVAVNGGSDVTRWATVAVAC